MRKAAIFAAVCVAAWARSASAQCLGDFNGDGTVSVDELVTAVDNALNGCQVSALRFVDNGDGTVTDNKTGLTWEKKDNLDGVTNDADPHDADNGYTWCSGTLPNCTNSADPLDGTAYTDFLVKLNSGASTDGGAKTLITGCFADHCDWRLPTIVELRGTTQGFCRGGSGACIDPAFGPTPADSFWWSVTTVAGYPASAWGVDFIFGVVSGFYKTDGHYVRAVRGGS